MATGTSTIEAQQARAAADAPAARRAARYAGFTLLEILVVVLIIGVLTAGMLLSMNFAGKDTQLETESKRLLALMSYVQEQAELQTRDYGIYFGQSGYEFVVYDVRTGMWRSVTEDDALGERTLPSGLDFKLVVDARQIVLDETMKTPPDPSATSNSDSDSDSASSPPAHPSAVPHTAASSDSDSGSSSDGDSDSNSQATAFAPQVMLFSSGDLSSFTITLERPGAGRSITLDENRNGEIVAKPMAEGGS